MRRDDVEHALDALASEVPASNADAASLIARGRQRIVRQRVVIIGIAAAVIATAAGVGAVANNHDARRTVAPAPTTSTTTSEAGFGPSRQIAVASSLEAWKCLNPLQYTDNGGRSWKTIALPIQIPANNLTCTAVAGGNAWASWQDSRDKFHLLRIRDAKDPKVVSFPRLPERSGLGPLTFVDRDHGWVQTSTYNSVEPTRLYRTLDGGATWKLATTNVAAGPIAFADADRGWSSDGAALFRTQDGGASWRTVDLPTPAAPRSRIPFFQVEAHDNSIVVWGGVPKRDARYQPFFDLSTDDGRTWSLQTGPEGFELPGVTGNTFDAVDGQHWRLTSGNAFRITDDGGTTWQTRPDVPIAMSIGSISFPTPDVGWITSDVGTILRTIDAGRTWTDVTNSFVVPETTTTTPIPPEPAVPSQLAFASATEGWICGDQFEYTTDAFETVVKKVDIPTPATTITPDYSQEPLCAATPGGNAWLLRGSGNPDQPELVRIRSSGSDVQVFPFARIPRSTVESISFVDADNGWALVAHEPAGAPAVRDLYRTRNGGATWSLFLQHAPAVRSLDFDTSDRGWAVSGKGAQLVATTDGGRTWREVTVPTPTPYSGLPLGVRSVQVRGNVIVAFGEQPTGNFFSPFFDVSTDGGRTWSRRPGPRALSGTLPNAFDVADADHWALGWANFLYVTDDGGRTWVDRAQFAGVYMIEDIALLDANVAFVSGLGDPLSGSAVLLRTTDGGDHWSTIDEQTPVGPPGHVASFPGGIIGCPTRPLTPGLPTNAIAQAALAYVKFPNPSVSAVYRGNSGEGDFARVFSFNVGSCGPDVLGNIWVAYVHGVPNAGQGGSTARVTLALAHYADGWHVFGRYP